MELYDIVFCTSGNGQPWVGYVDEVYDDGEVQIQWWGWHRKKWQDTKKFDALGAGVQVIGPMPEVEDEWVRLNAIQYTTS